MALKHHLSLGGGGSVGPGISQIQNNALTDNSVNHFSVFNLQAKSLSINFFLHWPISFVFRCVWPGISGVKLSFFYEKFEAERQQ